MAGKPLWNIWRNVKPFGGHHKSIGSMKFSEHYCNQSSRASRTIVSQPLFTFAKMTRASKHAEDHTATHTSGAARSRAAWHALHTLQRERRVSEWWSARATGQHSHAGWNLWFEPITSTLLLLQLPHTRLPHHLSWHDACVDVRRVTRDDCAACSHTCSGAAA